jgi:multidrug efflux pump
VASLAFICGMIPMFIAGGAGANSRHSVATGIIGGMLSATTLALFFVPLFFVLILSASERLSRKKPAPAEAGAASGAVPAAPHAKVKGD